MSSITKKIADQLSLAAIMEKPKTGMIYQRADAETNLYRFVTSSGQFGLMYKAAEPVNLFVEDLHRMVKKSLIASGMKFNICSISIT